MRTDDELVALFMSGCNEAFDELLLRYQDRLYSYISYIVRNDDMADDLFQETFSTIVGFREIEIKQTAAQDDEVGLAGRYYYLNGKPIKMKGVNRHENSPELGHAITREQMKNEVMLMKRGNINHVRESPS